MATNETIDMPTLGTPTLDQLRVFLAVAESGSFSAAGRRLNRRQSVISYTIANLEAQLGGLVLFDRGRRRPALTEVGKTMLAEAQKLTLGVEGLLARARGLKAGLEPELAVAVDVMMPTERLTCILVAFRDAFPTVTLRLNVEGLGSVAQLVLDRTCAVGVSGPLAVGVGGLEQKPVGGVNLVHVAAPGHPLARLGRTLTLADVQGHVQLVLSDRSALSRGQDFGVLSPETWRLADLGAKHALLRAGLGWGGMPELSVRDDIDAGRLALLDVEPLSGVVYRLAAIHRIDSPPGPAARWFIARLAEGAPSVEDAPDQALAASAVSRRSHPSA
jgi:DNA-binding transcriptional LysR family regulator